MPSSSKSYRRCAGAPRRRHGLRLFAWLVLGAFALCPAAAADTASEPKVLVGVSDGHAFAQVEGADVGPCGQDLRVVETKHGPALEVTTAQSAPAVSNKEKELISIKEGTILVWVSFPENLLELLGNSASPPAIPHIFSLGNYGPGTASASVQLDAKNNPYLMMRAHGGAQDKSGGSGPRIHIKDLPILDRLPHMVGMVWKAGESHRGFLDGEFVAESKDPLGYVEGTESGTAIVFGGRGTAMGGEKVAVGKDFFPGLLIYRGEAYDRALTDKEIAQRFEAFRPGGKKN